VVTIRSPFCGHNTLLCVELNGEDISCYSNKIQSVSIGKCPYDHWLANKAHLNAITVTNISHSFHLQDGGKNQLAYIRNKITSLSPYVYCWRQALFSPLFVFLSVSWFVNRTRSSAIAEGPRFGCGKGGNVTSAGCQVTPQICAQIRLLLTTVRVHKLYLLTYTVWSHVACEFPWRCYDFANCYALVTYLLT